MSTNMYIGSLVETIFDILLDDARLAHTLVTQQYYLDLGLACHCAY